MKTYVIRIAAVLVFAVLFSTVGLSSTGYADKGVSDADKERIEQSFGKLPVYFIENQGQVHEDVAYYVKGSDKPLYFTSKGLTFALTGKDGDEVKRWAVKLEFVNANPKCKPRGEDKQEAIFSFFKGKPEEWKTGLPTYSKIVYEELWPGIDLVYKGTVNELKYEFAVKPGADPKHTRLAYHGNRCEFERDGRIESHHPFGRI